MSSPVLQRIRFNRRLGNAEGFHSLIVPAIVYLSAAALILHSMWPYFYHIKNETFIVLGLFATWRYGWAVTHYVRAVIYEFWHYPRLRRLAHGGERGPRHPRHVYFVIPSYREEAWVTLEAIHALFSNLAEIDATGTFIVATGSDEDDKAVYAAYRAHPYHDRVELVLQRQRHGKRIAMGHALRALARRYDGDPDSVTVFMDGDTFLPPRTLAESLPYFTRFHDLGAATTNEAAFINTRSLLYKEWFNLKFGQRHVLFKSHALSHKVLTLTGRFSLFRTSIITAEDFIRRVENDHIDHWMHGRFRFLMGDDKSTWFHLLEQGWKMLYLHDVIAYSLESRDDDFWKISLSLPYRWYGNTLRNNARALALGWRRTGLFIWWCLLDQRINMWTGLVGITGATILSLSKSFIYLPFYIAWVFIVKTLQMAVIALRGHPVSLLTIPLMLYNQWIGSLVKIRASFHLADQRWSKGGASQQADGNRVPVPHPLAPYLPNIGMVLSFSLFLFVMLLAEGALEWPRWPHARAIAGEGRGYIDLALHGVVPDDGRDDGAAIERALRLYGPTGPLLLQLPRGRIDLERPLRIERDDILLAGHGDATRLVAQFAGDGAMIDVAGRPAGGWFEARIEGDGVHLHATAARDLAPGDWLQIARPNDRQLFDRIGARRWRREQPMLRQTLVRVRARTDTGVVLSDPVPVDLSGVVRARRIAPVRRFGLRDLRLEYRVPGADPAATAGVFQNLHPAHRVDGLRLRWVVDCRVRGLTVDMAGRHALHLDQVAGCRFRDLRARGAWNKGPGGNGYVRIARAHRNRFEHIELRGLRHLAIQWSSSDNRIVRVRGDTDINFHGGYSRRNRVENVRLTLPEHHPWPPVFRTPADARWAPPDGEGNEVIDCRWRSGPRQPWRPCP